MSFSVDKLLSQAQYFASPGRYLFTLNGPSRYSTQLPGFLSIENMPRSLREGLLCHQVTLPNRSLTTQEEFRHGPSRKIATNVTFGDLDASFYWMGSTKEQGKQVHKFFNDWQNFIVGRADDGTRGGYDPSSFYGPAFYENYIMDATLKVFSPQSMDASDATATFKFYELYPLTLNPIQFSWNNTDDVLSFTISFTYRTWESI